MTDPIDFFWQDIVFWHFGNIFPKCKFRVQVRDISAVVISKNFARVRKEK